MKIEPSVNFVYYVHFDAPSLEALIKLGCDHYDGHCKQSAQPGGFIARWHATITGTDGWPSLEYATATWRELDTCCKILEMIPRTPNSHYTQEEINLLLKLMVSLHRVLNYSRQLHEDIKSMLEARTEF